MGQIGVCLREPQKLWGRGGGTSPLVNDCSPATATLQHRPEAQPRYRRRQPDAHATSAEPLRPPASARLPPNAAMHSASGGRGPSCHAAAASPSPADGLEVSTRNPATAEMPNRENSPPSAIGALVPCSVTLGLGGPQVTEGARTHLCCHPGKNAIALERRDE